ncbi:hypothetical protein HNI00_10400 [Thermoleptolyngbya oregonensis NK1-22]|uniref:SPOR domain-containing protein n=1 Tax=Thermoleptolyngbya oregonensis NK1-22 TaxID=2547457 RepID=A0AA96Y541_9CYAN|nr:hypothetical protein [Thermoleptolyngbya oregonensis]WOB43521.1 hypothetical protein HNI00_10400 [Thermoleptolyngbya oregonensis NK1-22]
MRRSPATPSQSSSSTPLHPALQAIFENLDLRLEDELARYRRQQGRRGVAPALQDNRRADSLTAQAEARSLPARWNESSRGAAESRPYLQLAPDAVRNTDSHSPLPDLGYAPEPQVRPELLLGGAIAPQMAPPAADYGAVPLHPPHDHDLYPTAEPAAEPDDYLESSEYLLRNLAEDERDLRASQQEPGMLQSLLTPLGIGSMILLLLSSLSFGYLVMNPAGLSVIGLGEAARRTADGSTPGANAGADGSLAADAGAGNSGISPDLSAQEFPEVNLDTLSTLPSGRTAILEPSAEADSSDSSSEPPVLSGSPLPEEAPSVPTEASTTEPVAPAQPAARSAPSSPTPPHPASRTSAPARSQPAASSRSESRPAATAAAPAPRASASSAASRAAEPAPRPAPSAEPAAPQDVATAPRQPAIAPSPAAPSSNRYYVVVDFSGDRSLEQAREVVGDAWVRNFDNGAKIQLGVFGDAASARDLAASLQQQGLPAQVYQP